MNIHYTIANRAFNKYFKYNLSDLSTYRTQMMGIATLMIIICHSCASKVIMPSFLAYLFRFGNIGVDIFLFLSGIGLYYSLSKNNLSSKEDYTSFYKRRFYRIYIPYLIVFIPSCLIFFISCCTIFIPSTYREIQMDHRPRDNNSPVDIKQHSHFRPVFNKCAI